MFSLDRDKKYSKIKNYLIINVSLGYEDLLEMNIVFRCNRKGPF